MKKIFFILCLIAISNVVGAQVSTDSEILPVEEYDDVHGHIEDQTHQRCEWGSE